MSESSQVIVATCRDIAEAALIRAVLTGHDIPVHISGENHAAMIGAGPSAVRQAVWVAREDAEQALALIEEMREGGAAALADDEVPADDTAERDETVTADGAVVGPIDGALSRDGDTVARLGKRDRITLAFLAGMMLQHGTAHMSARAWKRGFILAATQMFGWYTLASSDVKLGGALVIGTIAMDLIGAVAVIVQGTPPLPTARVHRSG